MEETFYDKFCRYKKLLKDKNVQFLKHMFEYYDLYKEELNVNDNEVNADKLMVFTAVKDYENKFNFCEV